MKTIWIYISTFFAGIITGLIIFFKLDKPETVINDNQRIGKVKQRGENVSGMIEKNREAESLSRMEQRKARRAERRAKRNNSTID